MWTVACYSCRVRQRVSPVDKCLLARSYTLKPFLSLSLSFTVLGCADLKPVPEYQQRRYKKKFGNETLWIRIASHRKALYCEDDVNTYNFNSVVPLSVSSSLFLSLSHSPIRYIYIFIYSMCPYIGEQEASRKFVSFAIVVAVEVLRFILSFIWCYCSFFFFFSVPNIFSMPRCSLALSSCVCFTVPWCVCVCAISEFSYPYNILSVVGYATVFLPLLLAPWLFFSFILVARRCSHVRCFFLYSSSTREQKRKRRVSERENGIAKKKRKK